MDKEKILQETENFMRGNVPKSRLTSDGSDENYLTHVLGVRKFGIHLVEVYKADRFVVEMAALLHDVGADAGKKHAFESARIAKDFLLQFDIPQEIQKKIIGCIETHSRDSITETLEQQIIQDADGISFYTGLGYKFYFGKKKAIHSLEKAKELTRAKIKDMMAKVKTEEGIKLAEDGPKKALEYLESV